MPRTHLRDLIIVLPGITGSVLQKDGRDIWAMSAGAGWAALTSGGESLRALQLGGDDPELDDLGDGVSAPRLIDGFALMPGLMKSDGYRRLVALLQQRFLLTPATSDPSDDRPANFIPLPYDWRRDNRAASRRLAALVDRKLPQWRAHSGADDAKVILVAHSMGGLVARDYLERLDGWRTCRALITFGTPFRGSVNALSFLANGYKQAFLDLSNVLRSCTSVYQLLPIDAVVKIGEDYTTADAVSGVAGIDQERVRAARAFHKSILDAVRQREAGGDFYTILPVAGRGQPTLQSAVVAGGQLHTALDLPPSFDTQLADGDGTVPLLSATPPEFVDRYYDTFFAERHALLQSNQAVLDLLDQRVQRMQMKVPPALLGPEADPGRARQPSIALTLDDMYFTDEGARATARVHGWHGLSAALEASIEPLADGPALKRPLTRRRRFWELPLEDLPPGGYRLTIQTVEQSPEAPGPVHDLFLIAERPA